MPNKVSRKNIFTISALLAVAIILVFFTIQKNYLSTKTPSVYGDIEGSFSVNQKVTIPIIVDTQKNQINALEAYLKYDPTAVRVESISKDESFFELWISGEPKFNNDTGDISFAGGLPNPGFSGQGRIGSIDITPLKTGMQTISFDADTRMLLNDSLGTAVKLDLKTIKFGVK